MSDLIADTEYGKVRGINKISALNTAYNAFLGIRYATPPIGELRFKDPLPPAKWEDVYDATQEKSGCFETNSFLKKITGSEDSLVLNIFTKSLHPEKAYPVMVYLYGGGFQNGSSTTQVYGPDFFMMSDVILVTLNYRVGALGFMCLKDKGLNVPGNAGLKDQLLALKFVKNNIEHFGGDPNNITLFGQSAGGSSVSWHCVSERSKGLFNRAIIMSGCILNSWSLTPHRDWANRLARKLGYDGSENESEILEFLQKADPVKIVEFQKTLLNKDEIGRIAFSFAPHVESYITEDTFIPSNPVDLLRKAWSNDIDILIGGVADEGLMYLENIKDNPAILAYFNLNQVVPPEVGLPVDSPIVIEFVENLRRIYYPTSNDPTKDELAFCKIKTDQYFWHGLQRIVQGRQNSGGSGKTFMYRFAVDSPTQNHYRIRRLGANVRGVCHADEVSYMFCTALGAVPERESMEFKAIQRFVSVLTSFAATGNPNANLTDADMQNVQFDPVNSKEPPYKGLKVEENLKFEILPEHQRLSSWNQLYKDSNTPLY